MLFNEVNLYNWKIDQRNLKHIRYPVTLFTCQLRKVKYLTVGKTQSHKTMK